MPHTKLHLAYLGWLGIEFSTHKILRIMTCKKHCFRVNIVGFMARIVCDFFDYILFYITFTIKRCVMLILWLTNLFFVFFCIEKEVKAYNDMN